MKLEILQIDKIIYSGEVTQIKGQSPAGEFEIYEGHAPMVALLKEGPLHLEEIKENQPRPLDFQLLGGILKVLPHEAVLLAE